MAETTKPVTKPAMAIKAPTTAVKHAHEDAFEIGSTEHERHERRVEHTHAGGDKPHHHDGPRFGVGAEVKISVQV
jgi:hypothetical protein